MINEDRQEALEAFDPDIGNIRLIGTNKRSQTDYTDVFEVELTGDEIITIRKALEQPAMGWLPIETAPKDGTRILLAAIGNSNKYCVDSRTYIGDPTLRLWWASSGSWSEELKKFWDEVEPSGFANLTHWMPLPELPIRGNTGPI